MTGYVVGERARTDLAEIYRYTRKTWVSAKRTNISKGSSERSIGSVEGRHLRDQFRRGSA